MMFVRLVSNSLLPLLFSSVFAICLTWRIEDPPFNSLLFALLAAAGGLQGIYG